MRALPSIQKAHPEAHILIVGEDGKGYGKSAPRGTTYRQMYTKELQSKVNWDTIHFLGRIPHATLINLYQISSAHVYLTYPFVLSWSLVEAMSAGCLVVGSKTPPVEELLQHNRTGLLVDFFSSEQLAETINSVLKDRQKFMPIRNNARNLIVEKYSLGKCIPKIEDIMSKLGK